MSRDYLNRRGLILLGILAAFGAWELYAVFVDEAGPETIITLSEYVWWLIELIGWPAWVGVAGFCGWLTLHFLGRRFGLRWP